jgi:hypothetical protein
MEKCKFTLPIDFSYEDEEVNPGSLSLPASRVASCFGWVG